MAIEQRPQGETQGDTQASAHPAGLARRSRRWYAPLRTIVLTWLSIAAAPILWASVDSAAAMGFRGGGPFAASNAHRTASYRAPTRNTRVAVRAKNAQWGRLRFAARIVRLPPPVNRPPPHRVWPHRPIFTKLPQLPSTSASVTPNVSLPATTANGTGGGAAPGAAVAATDRRFVRDEVLVRFAANLPPQAIVSLAQDQRLALLGIHRLPLINTVLYRFRITDRREVASGIGGLTGDSRIGSAQPNYIYRLQDAGAPPAAPVGDRNQYVVSKLHLPQAHALATGNHVLVAVIDSGIDVAHPELDGTVVGGFDALPGDRLPRAHGTNMASAIAAHGRLMGVAPAAHILAVRAFRDDDTGSRSTTANILDALHWAVNSSARVVNMSFTGPEDAALHELVIVARRNGMVLVAAAGNDGPQAPPDYPAAYPEVIAVTATDVDDHLLGVANRGPYVSVAAPGVDIFVAAPNRAYGFTSGTSIATAHVSGLVALLLERNPRLTPDAVQAILMGTATDLGPKGRDDAFGAGLVDAYAALRAIAPATAVSELTH